MKTAIIGSGITGSILGNYLGSEATIYEKESFLGGRSSSVHLPEIGHFDTGSAFFNSHLNYIKNNEDCTFEFIKYINQTIPFSLLKKHELYPDSYFPIHGMSKLCESLIKKNQLFLKHELQTIQRNQNLNSWDLIFSNGQKETFERVILTSPLPTSLSIIKNTGVFQTWDDITRYRDDYSPYLKSIVIWKNISQNIILRLSNLLTYSFAYKSEEIDFITIESLKYPLSNHIILSILFSRAFSTRNFERWVKKRREPTDFAIKSILYTTQNFFSILEIDEMENLNPDSIRVYRYRYANSENPLFEKNVLINLDNPIFDIYIDLCRQNNLWLTGDWMWGKGMINSAFGAKSICEFL